MKKLSKIESSDLKVIGQRLLKVRKTAGWSQKKFANWLGCSLSSYGNCERGKKDILGKYIRKIKRGFGVDLNGFVPLGEPVKKLLVFPRRSLKFRIPKELYCSLITWRNNNINEYTQFLQETYSKWQRKLISACSAFLFAACVSYLFWVTQIRSGDPVELSAQIGLIMSFSLMIILSPFEVWGTLKFIKWKRH